MEYIEQHGRANVWCTPTQDTQYMVKPKRLTKPVGAVRKFSLLGQRYSLPTDTSTYHVFMFGQVPASFFNIMEGQAIWRKASTICRQNNILIDIYLDNGIQFPRHDSWFLILPDKNILIAVKDQPRIPFSLTTHVPAVRFYSNAFFNSTRRLEPVESKLNPGTDFTVNWEIYVHGKTINTMQDISDMATLFNQQYAKRGFAYGIVNGYKVSILNALSMTIGDVVEVVHDSTICWVVDIPFNQLSSFHSTLDSESKYLLTSLSGLNALEKQTVSNDTFFNDAVIYYKDDIDFFLYKTVNNIKKGVIYHRNRTNSVRMLTHKDYSIPTAALHAYVGSTNLFTNTDGLVVRMYLRKSGYDRMLVNDTNRINELYKLVDLNRASDQTSGWFSALQNLKSIMVGTESNVACWRAAHLEASSYVSLMRSYSPDIDQRLVTEAYGYHSATKVLSPPVALASLASDVNSQHTVLPTPGTFGALSVYRYGVPVADTEVKAGSFYPPITATSTVGKLVTPVTVDKTELLPNGLRPAMVELVPSISSPLWGRTYNVENETGLNHYGGAKRFYKAMRTVGNIPMVWIDVTGTSDYTATFYKDASNNNLFSYQWHIDLETWLVCVDNADYHGFNEITINAAAGDSQFSIMEHHRTDDNGLVITSILKPILPPRNLEIFTNHDRLIEGLDYYINEAEYSAVVCSVKPYRTYRAPGVSLYTRVNGLIGPSFTRDTRAEYGFVKNGVISANGNYDIRDSKPYRLYVDGKLINVDYLRDETIQTAKEILMEDPNPAYFLAPALSGKPYCFANTIYDIPELPTPLSNHALREADFVKDQEIADYLTIRFPSPVLETPLYAAAPYELFSPFMFKILMAMKTNVIQLADYLPLPTDGKLEEVVDSFKWLLSFDPCRKNNEWWKGFVVIKAHPYTNRIQVTPAQRAFLLRINTFYLQGKIDVNNAIEII
jgi:hypothetical protein